MNEQDQKIMAIVKNELSYAAHDFDHVMRVYHTCKLYTKKAKQIAGERIEYMTVFFKTLKAEIDGLI